MSYNDEYRNPQHIKSLTEAIRKTVTRPWNIMEICGGQTHVIARYRLEEMLPKEIRLLHGPGCPVCVTSETIIDQAIELAQRQNIILASFGDMMRVPGSKTDLLTAKARGADVRILYSPLDALKIAADNPDKHIIFFAIGFETTIPIYLTTIKEALRQSISNISLLTSLFTVPPAIEAILSDPLCQVNGFLLAGHVCAITGNQPYYRLAEIYKTPMIVTGFEPADLLYGIYQCIKQLEAGIYKVNNAYKRAVSDNGNIKARDLMFEMLEPCDLEWRGIGVLPKSGLKLKSIYISQKKYVPLVIERVGKDLETVCIAGDIMRGLKQADDCPYFGNKCLPSHPIGAPMVSSEGVCAAYYKYK